KKQLLVAVPARTAPRELDTYIKSEEQEVAQQTHLKCLQRYERFPLTFTNGENLALQLYRSTLLELLTKLDISDGAFQFQTWGLGVPQPVVTEPTLEWLQPADAFEDGEPNFFSLLRWDYRFVETLYGRDDDLRKILTWAEGGSKATSARLITGEG